MAKALIALVAALGLMAGLAGCGSSSSTNSKATSSAAATPSAASAAATAQVTRVASLKGPTSIGIANLINGTDSAGEFEFTVSGAADEIVPSLIKGDVDIALVPANVASVVYNKTQGGIKVLNINTLGVLSVVTGDESVKSLEDLAGRTVLMTGKGATPEYVMNYLLEKAGIADQVTLEFKSEATEVGAALAQDSSAIGVLPEPYVTAVCTKNQLLSPVISLAEAWDVASGDSGSRLVTGVTVVRTEYLESHPGEVASFTAQQRQSVDAVNSDPEGAGEIVASIGIVDNAKVAAAAIPRCNIVCFDGPVMQAALGSYLQVLYDADPASIGGAMPGDDFYYLGD